MKEFNSNNLSHEELTILESLYKSLLRPYGPLGKIDSVCLTNLAQAIELLPDRQKRAVYLYLNREHFRQIRLDRALFSLTTVNFRSIYDPKIINYIRRAIDWEKYDPSVALGFVKLYDNFSSYNPNACKTFTIVQIDGIIDELPQYISDVLDLQFGLVTGLPLTLKEVAKKLNISLCDCKYLSELGLSILKKEYC